MSEIERKLGLSNFSSFSEQDNLLCTTPGSVAAAISSALETTSEDNTILTDHEDSNFYQLDQFPQNRYNHTQRGENTALNTLNDSVTESLVNRERPPQQYTSLLQPIPPLRPETFTDCDCVCGSNNAQTLLAHTSEGNSSDRRRSTKTSDSRIDSTDENHVDDEFRSSSASSQVLHQPFSSSLLSSSSQMADRQDCSSESFCNTSSKNIDRDKSDNCETYQGSHSKEKSASNRREVDTGGGEDDRLFKSSCKIVQLPEKSASQDLSFSSHHQHRHHQSRNKDSRIPVGIAVAWQRFVTTSSNNPSTTSTMTTKAECGSKSNRMSSSAMSSPTKYPSRPSSASLLKSTASVNSSSNGGNLVCSSNDYSASNPNIRIDDNDSNILSIGNNNRPMSACGEANIGSSGNLASFCPSSNNSVLGRPLPSSSVPPNLGYPTGYSSQYASHPYHHHNVMTPYLEFSYGTAAAAHAAQTSHRQFAVPSPLSSPHHHSHPTLLARNGHPYWGLDNPPPPPPSVPLLSPVMPASSGADYLQHFPMQQHNMHLHSPHHFHQQHLLATASRRISPSPSTPSPSSSYNTYLQFMYPQDAASALNKGPSYYDHYFHQQHQMRLQNEGYLHQQAPYPSTPTLSVGGSGSSSSGGGGVNSSNGTLGEHDTCGKNNSGGNENVSSSSSGFDLLANSNNISSNAGGSARSTSASLINTHRAIPMQVASPISMTSSSLLSCLPLGSGGIRVSTPTTTSLSLPSTTAPASITTISTSAVTSSDGSAFSSFPTKPATASQQNPAGRGSQSSVGVLSAANSHELPASTAPTTTTGSSSSSSPSPSLFLIHHQQQHPHLFASSTGSLSPKSLTSSTPSPVTVHDFNSGLNVVISSSAANNSTITNINMAAATRKGATPSPISLTPTRALLSPFPPSSPYSPSPIPNNHDNHRELLACKHDNSSPLLTKIKPIPINGHTRETYSSGCGSLTTPPPMSSPLLSLAHHNNMRNHTNNNNNNNNNNKTSSISTPMSSPSSFASGQKHDFKRLESLIERRDSESISPLVLIPQHSPATSATSSILDSDEHQQFKLTQLAAEEKEVIKEDSVEDVPHDKETTFYISVKLENPPDPPTATAAAKVEEYQQNESFQVIPPTSKHDVVQVASDIAVCAKSKQNIKSELCMINSAGAGGASQPSSEIQEDGGECQDGVKVEVVSYANNDINTTRTRIMHDHDSNAPTNTGSACNDNDGGVIGVSRYGGGKGCKHASSEKVDSTSTAKEINDARDKNINKVAEENDVPEPTLLLCSSNFNESNSKRKDGYFKTSDNFATFSNHNNNNQSDSIKPVTLTTENCLSQDDSNHEAQKQSTIPSIRQTTTIKCKSPKKTEPVGKCRPHMRPSLKIKTSVNEKKTKKNGKGEKKGKWKLDSMPSVDEKDIADDSFQATLLKSSNSKRKTFSVCNKVEKNPKAKSRLKVGTIVDSKQISLESFSSSTTVSTPKSNVKNFEKLEGAKKKKVKEAKKSGNFFDQDCKEQIAKKKDGCAVKKRKNNESRTKTDDILCEKAAMSKGLIEKKTRRSKKAVVVEDSSKKTRKRGGGTKTQNKKTDQHGTSVQGWVPPTVLKGPPAMTNNNYQQCVKKTSDIDNSGHFVAPTMTVASGDNLNSESCPQGHYSASSQQQHPMTVLLHQSTPMLQSPSHVTFLITSPTLDRSGGTSPLRIPAYIPRSGGGNTTTAAVVASTDELVGGNGENYNGPATLTLHRDVDTTSSTQPTFYQPPPAITIQYHHSAPATPMAMEAASPSSLDLLATVAQEFGSREDLGKRQSIDGSCNVSIYGESPPMSPQKSPGAYHNLSYCNTPTQIPQKIPTNNEIFTTSSPSASFPSLPPPVLKCTTDKMSSSPKKQVAKIKANQKETTKTSNSITLKQSSKRVSTKKVGKKEKRTVSDSAFYTPPVVLLKIPQVPGLCQKKTAAKKVRNDTEMISFKAKTDKTVMIEAKKKTSSKKQAKDPEKLIMRTKKGIQRTSKNDGDGTIRRKEQKIISKSASVSLHLPLASPSKSPLLLSLPATATTVSGNQNSQYAKKRAKKNKPKNDGTISSSMANTVPSTAFSTDHSITTTPSPTKERPSPFYIPPERISAFAKQVISRRSSAAGSSPTKQQNSNGGNATSPSKQKQQGSPSAFSPIHKQHSLPNSPTITMPQLIPYDVPVEPSTSVTPLTKKHSLSPGLSSIAVKVNHYDNISSSVPKMVNLKRFPRNSKKPTAQLPPPLLIPSVSSVSHERKDNGDVSNDPRSSFEQDTKKTDNFDSRIGNRSPSSCSSNTGLAKGSCRKKKRFGSNHGGMEKTKRKMQVREDKHQKAAKKRHLSAVGIRDTGKKEKKKKSSQSFVLNEKVPEIKITQVTSASGNAPNTQTSPAFNPLTPPLTAKSSVEGEDDSEAYKGSPHRRSAFACLQVPRGSSTPCSSLASRRSSPLTNVDEEGETETTTENENDSSNVWVADPTFAVSAIKLTTFSSAGSNQPTDAEESAADDDNAVCKRKTNAETVENCNKPPTLSAYNYNKQHEDINLHPTDQQRKKSLERERFFKVQSRLKAFVHFKPRQLTSYKKDSHSKTPCLVAESINKSRPMDMEDNAVRDGDEDFHLDLEVASITTHNAPRRKAVEKAEGAITATSSYSATLTGTNKRGKPSTNRNSENYLSNFSPSTSQSTSHHGQYTKDALTNSSSRKASPELREGRRRKKRRTSECHVLGSEMDADDEDEEELPDINDVPSSSLLLPFTKSRLIYKTPESHNTHITMSAAAAAVVVNGNANNAQTAPSTPSSSFAVLTSPSSSMKKPMKRSARSSTTSSCASTKSISRANKGHSLSAGGDSAVEGGSFANRSGVAPTVSCSSSKDETRIPGKVQLDSVQELVDEMRILTDIQGLFYTGRLNALQPPDVYGVTLDNERGAPPHLIFSAEEVLEKCLREKKPQAEGLTSGLRICAYWSPQYSGLYPGRISTEFSPKFDPDEDLIPIEFDDGDTGMIKLKEIRLLSVNHPVREYDPNPLLTLEKKHRKRRHSSATGTSGGCVGDHDEPDCGESYCAKIGKLEEDEEDAEDDNDDHASGSGRLHHTSSKMMYWTWSGLGYKRPKSKKNRNKEFFQGIQRGNEVISVGDAALFISTGNERPFIGRVERFWERKGKKMVNVRWFYHPEEVKASSKRLSNLKYPGALFESPHIDENDVQTIARKCDVLPFADFKKHLSSSSPGSLRVAKLAVKSSSKPRDMYYVAGFYDPYTYNLTLKDLK